MIGDRRELPCGCVSDDGVPVVRCEYHAVEAAMRRAYPMASLPGPLGFQVLARLGADLGAARLSAARGPRP